MLWNSIGKTKTNRDKSAKGGLVRAIVLVILILLVLGALPTWPYSASWGYYPSGGLGLVLLVPGHSSDSQALAAQLLSVYQKASGAA